ncbi:MULTISPECIES: DUF1697 domain-containing protein [unclassified Glutamicibacter]|uniref:DUF1697 domain-containing protein n=1 Tax=unclassified Glutamicibacter TaxID=2627139 RepID=UPI000F9312AD
MTRYAVFLRGVNVGGVKVLMKDLAQLLLAAGFTDVKTLLASGNAVLSASSSDPLEVQEHCNAVLAGHYQRPIPTLVCTVAEIQQLSQPFPLPLPDPASEHHGYFTLCESAEDAQAVGAAIQGLAGPGAYLVQGRAVAWIVRKGESTANPIGKLMAAQAKQRIVTTRNHNTLVKLAKILG